jgi:hypothetical protein
MRKPKSKVPAAKPDALFTRIVSILEQARSNVVRAVNTNMMAACWLIGRQLFWSHYRPSKSPTSMDRTGGYV